MANVECGANQTIESGHENSSDLVLVANIPNAKFHVL